jgi:hypothetical protein
MTPVQIPMGAHAAGDLAGRTVNLPPGRGKAQKSVQQIHDAMFYEGQIRTSGKSIEYLTV